MEQWWLDAGWPWFSDWLTSPGLAALAAVLAAVIAYASGRSQRRAESWWDTARWAADHMVSGASTGRRKAGLAVLAALASSKRLNDDQLDVIRALTDLTLDPIGDGDAADDAARPNRRGGPRRSRGILGARRGAQS